jgi:BASS family bile acid:Na+ symporter
MSKAGTILLAVLLVVVLVAGWRAIASLIGDGTLLACAAFAVIGLAVGHIFGGPEGDDRTVLALATASRHPGVAIAIGAALFPNLKQEGVAVLLYLLCCTVLSIPYTSWRKRQHDRREAVTVRL